MNLSKLCFLLYLFAFLHISIAQIPQTMSYQGTLSDSAGQAVVNGNYEMTFKLYEQESGGTSIWNETQIVIVKDGLFNVILGKIEPMDELFDKPYWLGVTVGIESELNPRIELTSSAYSLNARQIMGTSNVFPSVGNVGIGTNEPQANLDVRGRTFKLGSAVYSNDNLSGRSILSSDGENTDINPAKDDVGEVRVRDGNGTGALTFSNFNLSSINSYSNIEDDTPSSLLLQTNGGNVGIDVDYADEKLQVAGIIHSTTGGFKFPDGSVQITAATDGSSVGNTLDQAYDQGGLGVGRLITADAGAVHIGGVDGVLLTGTLESGDIPAEGPGTRLMWYPAKAAFRVGTLIDFYGSSWDADSIGLNSVSFGRNTKAIGLASTAMGKGATASGNSSTSMGTFTTSSGGSSIAMGYHTTASANSSTAMGEYTIASGLTSTAMGEYTTASGNYSTAMGSYVSTNESAGSFIIGDNSTLNKTLSSETNQMTMRFAGGYRLYSNSTLTTGVYMNGGVSGWINYSDRNKKENFQEIDGEQLLKKISTLLITEWNYKGTDPSIRYIGPTAQDFHKAFGLAGNDSLGINSICIDGVNMAAIQALEKRTTELKKENQLLNSEIQSLRDMVTELKKTVENLHIKLTNQSNLGRIVN